MYRGLSRRNERDQRDLSRKSSDDDDDNDDESRESSSSDDDNLPLTHPRNSTAKKALKAALKPQKKEEPDPIGGNIYKFFAFLSMGTHKHAFRKGSEDGDEDDEEVALFTPPKSTFDKSVLYIGLGTIVLIQFVAPLCLFGSNIFKIIGNINFPAWSDYDVTQWLVVLLAWAFLFCFILFCYNAIRDDFDESKKVCRLAEGLSRDGRPVKKWMLVFDAFINCYGAILLSIAMFTVIYNEPDAQGVIMDALAIAFILSIDDIASQLGFLSNVWDSQKVGRFYDEMEKRGLLPPEQSKEAAKDESDDDSERDASTMNSESDEDVDAVQRLGKGFRGAAGEVELIRWPSRIYTCTKCCLFILLILALPTPLYLTTGAEKDEDLMRFINYLTDWENFANNTQTLINDKTSTTESPSVANVTMNTSRRLFREVGAGEVIHGRPLYVEI